MDNTSRDNEHCKDIATFLMAFPGGREETTSPEAIEAMPKEGKVGLPEEQEAAIAAETSTG